MKSVRSILNVRDTILLIIGVVVASAPDPYSIIVMRSRLARNLRRVFQEYVRVYSYLQLCC